jgi:hypothetical protein
VPLSVNGSSIWATTSLHDDRAQRLVGEHAALADRRRSQPELGRCGSLASALGVPRPCRGKSSRCARPARRDPLGSKRSGRPLVDDRGDPGIHARRRLLWSGAAHHDRGRSAWPVPAHGDWRVTRPGEGSPARKEPGVEVDDASQCFDRSKTMPAISSVLPGYCPNALLSRAGPAWAAPVRKPFTLMAGRAMSVPTVARFVPQVIRATRSHCAVAMHERRQANVGRGSSRAAKWPCSGSVSKVGTSGKAALFAHRNCPLQQFRRAPSRARGHPRPGRWEQCG